MNMVVVYRVYAPEAWLLCFTHAVEAAIGGIPMESEVEPSASTTAICQACGDPHRFSRFLDKYSEFRQREGK